MSATADRQGVIVSCPSCGRANRLRYNALGKASRCGNCRANLPPLSEPIEIGGRGQLRRRGRGQFAAAPRRLLGAVVRAVPHGGAGTGTVARANAGRYLVVKVNTDVVTEVAARFTIRSIPTLALVFNGREIDRVTGVRPASEIEAFAHNAPWPPQHPALRKSLVPRPALPFFRCPFLSRSGPSTQGPWTDQEPRTD